MHAVRLGRPSSLARPASNLLRTFTSSPSVSSKYERSPTLANVTPDGLASFKANQKEFRARIEQQKADKAKENIKNLQEATAEPDEHAKKGPLSSLIYGTKEGREMDKEIERSHSQQMARGKYVHSIVFHDVHGDKVDEYVDLVGKWYPKMASMPENKVHLVGSWRTEVGDCDTFVHIWEYQKYHGYHESLHSIAAHPDFPAFDAKLKTLIKGKKTSLMQEFGFWPTTPPRRLGGLFELRAYTIYPGKVKEWEEHWQTGLKARREVMEGVGAWFVSVGALDTVYQMWQFADLEERKVGREKSWDQKGWAETTHKTVPLIQHQKSSVLIPMEWSPVG